MASMRLVQKLSIATLVLISIHTVNLLTGGPSWQVERLFHLGLEGNLTTWFSSLLWALAAVAAYQCSQAASSKPERRRWLGVAIGLLLLSIDEVAMMHESFSGAFSRHFLPEGSMSRFSASGWPIVFGPFVLALFIGGVVLIGRTLGSPVVKRRLLIGMAMVLAGGWFLEITTNFLNHDSLQLLWEIEIILEEGLEMFGAIVILSGLLIHQKTLRRQLSEVR